MAVQLDLISSIPYFHGLSRAELEDVKGSVFEKKAERNDIVLTEGDPSTALLFLVSGALKLFKTSSEGKEQILRIVKPGEAVNDVSIFDGGPNFAGAQAMCPVVLYGIDGKNLSTIMDKYPEISRNSRRILAQQVRHLGALVEDLSFKPVIGRVAKILLEYARETPGPRPRLTQQEMAAMAGTAREVVGRSLKALEEEGAIRLEHNRLVVENRKALEDIVAAFS